MCCSCFHLFLNSPTIAWLLLFINLSYICKKIWGWIHVGLLNLYMWSLKLSHLNVVTCYLTIKDYLMFNSLSWNNKNIMSYCRPQWCKTFEGLALEIVCPWGQPFVRRPFIRVFIGLVPVTCEDLLQYTDCTNTKFAYSYYYVKSAELLNFFNIPN